MPYRTHRIGLGPDSLMKMPTGNILTPDDTNSTDKLVAALAPLRWSREGTSGYGEHAVLCAENDVPEMISNERCEQPNYPIGVVKVPQPSPDAGETQHFVLELPIDGAVPSGDEIGVLAKGNGKYKLLAAVAAALNTGVVGSNNAITWTAREGGVGGNAVTIAITNPGGTVAAEVVTVTGNAISVAARTSSGSITSTAAQIMAAIQQHGEADRLVSVANQGASTGAGVVAAVAATPLAGGLAGVGRYLETTDTGWALIQF